MKMCTGCDTEKPEAEFVWRNKSKGKRSSRCRDCTRSAIRDHYSANKEKYITKARTRQSTYSTTVLTYIAEYLSKHPCVDCGIADIRVLEFDHVRGEKKFNIASAARDQISMASLKEEIEKCEVRCANDHRIVTAERGGWKRNDIYAFVYPLTSDQVKG